MDRPKSESIEDWPMRASDLIPVDFANADEDGAVRLVTRGTVEHLAAQGIALAPGLVVVMTDGEVVAEGRCELRDGQWVAHVTKWLS